MNEKIYLVALHKIWISQKKMFDIFCSEQKYRDFYEKLDYNLLKKYKIPDDKISSILSYKQKINLSDINIFLLTNNVKIITFNEIDYPKSLKNIFNQPFLIYIKWKIESPSIAFIWSRNMSSYWKKIIEKFVPEIWKYFSIVSGWAIWCDTYSHQIALNNNILTICVLWTWIDITYPSWNLKLYNDIVEKWWAIISIFPLWEPWNPYNFPIRNEIVAWLSHWVFIVEAKEKSWTLITAKLALDLWKDVFCVPWDIFKFNYVWSNSLILNWESKLVIWPNDILSEYNINTVNILEKSIKINLVDDVEKNIYNLLLEDSYTVDDLQRKLFLDISIVSFKLSMLEIYWYIKKWIDWRYEII
jgi:DNA processing protein